MRDLRERIAELEFDMDWDEENNYAMLNASNGLWQEQTDEWFRSHYYRRADKILTTVAAAVEQSICTKIYYKREVVQWLRT